MNRATKWLGLAIVGLTIGPVAPAEAGLILTGATLTDTQRGDVQDSTFNGGNYGHPYWTNNTYSQTGATLNDPSNTNSYKDNYVSVSSTSSGSASVTPGPSSFSELKFNLSSSTRGSNSMGAYAGTGNEESYKGSFTVDTTGTYLLTVKVDSASTFSLSTGSSGGTIMEGTVYLTDLKSGNYLAFLDSQATQYGGGGPKSKSLQVTLQAGETYIFNGLAQTSGDIHGEGGYATVGSYSGSSSVSFDLKPLSATPEPATIVLAGLGSLVGLGAAWRRRARAAA